MSQINESLPLLQQPDASLDGHALHRRTPCKVLRDKQTSASAQITERAEVNEQAVLTSERDISTCYLQDGGSTASGKRVTKKLILACSLSLTFMLFEVVGGYFADSVAIMSDAAHMFSDVLSFVVSVYCMRLIERRADAMYSFGYHRAETIGALMSILIVCVITGGLVLEAIQRLANPEHINGKLMFIVAALGIGFNLLLLFTLGHDHHVHLGGGSCGHDHGHCSGHSHSRLHAAAISANGRQHSHSHSYRGAPAELSTVCVSAGAEEEHAGDTAPSKTATQRATAKAHSSCCGHAHDHSTHSHEHVHDDTHSSACAHQHAGHAPQHDHAPTHTHSHACSHSHGHSHNHGHGHDDHSHDHDNQNLRGAIVHVIGDILQSVGVAIAGAVIWYTDGDPNWLWVDPACTFVFAITVVWVTKTLIVDITRDLMEAAPADIDVHALLEKMSAVSGVCGIHDLHVWRIGTGKVILTAHIDVAGKTSSNHVIRDVEELITQAGIAHSTVQLCNIEGATPTISRSIHGSAAGSGMLA